MSAPWHRPGREKPEVVGMNRRPKLLQEVDHPLVMVAAKRFLIFSAQKDVAIANTWRGDGARQKPVVGVMEEVHRSWSANVNFIVTS